MPLAMPVILWLLYKERINRREIYATGISVIGLVLLISSDIVVSPSFLIGDGLALLAMVMLTFYLCLSRRLTHLPSIWLYVVPMYALGGILFFTIGLIFTDSYAPSGWSEWWPVLGLGLLPTVVGHSMLNWCMQRMRGQIVALINMLHPVFAGIIGFAAFSEEPTTLFYIAGSLLSIAVLVVILGPERNDVAAPVAEIDVYHDDVTIDLTTSGSTADVESSDVAGESVAGA